MKKCLGSLEIMSSFNNIFFYSPNLQFLSQDLSLLLKERSLKTAKTLSEDDKFKLLTNNRLPSHPVKMETSRNFNPKAVSTKDKTRFIHYSKVSKKLFCLCCAIQPSADGANHAPTKWTDTGYQDWKNIYDIKGKKGINFHLKSSGHTENHGKATDFVNALKGKLNVKEKVFNKQKEERIKQNRELLGAVIKDIRFLGGQGLPLRGHRECYSESNPHQNRGNFLAFLNVIGTWDKTVKDVTDEVESKQRIGKRVQASMFSPLIQNQIITIFGEEIKKSIVQDVLEAGHYVIISDEATVHNEQYLTLGLRYLHKKERKIKEDWISFTKMESADAESVFELIKKELKSLGLPIQMCLGAAFDGAAVMTGKLTGVAARLKEEVDHAVTTHCYNHNLSLSVMGKKLTNIHYKSYFR